MCRFGKYFLLLLFLLSMSVEAKGDGWKVIENKFYSLFLPAEWCPQPGMPGNGVEPGMRKVKPYLIYYFAWHTPIRDKNDIPTRVGIDIQTYEKADGSAVSLDEARKLTIPPSVRIEDSYPSSDDLYCTGIKKSKEMDGSIVEYKILYLLEKDGDRVHCIKLDLRKDYYEKSSEAQQLVFAILNSFMVN